MNCSHRIKWAPLLMATAALFGACGASEGAATRPAGAPGTEADAAGSAVEADLATPNAGEAAAATPDTPSATGDDDAASTEPKTLQDYLGGFGGGFIGGGASDSAFDEEHFAEQQRLIEQEIQQCMKQQGFEYVPRSDAGVVVVFGGPQSQGVSPEDYAKERGFGISTGFDSLSEPAVALDPVQDPNREYIEGLSDGEADAWFAALYGSAPERNADGDVLSAESGVVVQVGPGIDGGPRGCAGEAETKVRGDFSAIASLADELSELDERVKADPRILEIDREWAACMRDAGYFYSTEAEAIDDIQTRFEPIMMSFFGDGPVELDVEDNGAGGGVIALSGGDFDLSPEEEAELAALQAFEIGVATASAACEAGTADEVREITARYEEQFVAENRAVLEAIAGGSGD